MPSFDRDSQSREALLQRWLATSQLPEPSEYYECLAFKRAAFLSVTDSVLMLFRLNLASQSFRVSIAVSSTDLITNLTLSSSLPVLAYYFQIRGSSALRSGVQLLPMIAGVVTALVVGGAGGPIVGYTNPFLLAGSKSPNTSVAIQRLCLSTSPLSIYSGYHGCHARTIDSLLDNYFHCVLGRHHLCIRLRKYQ